jgi:hypothetical protein
LKSSPGLGVGAAEWLARQDPMLVGADNSGLNVTPSSDPQLSNPAHQIMLVINGIHILENLRLDEVAARQAYEFALIVQPLKSWTFTGHPNGLGIGRDGFLSVTDGNAGKVLKVDFEGRVLGAIGSLGKGNGQFGEAHWVEVDSERNIYVGDVFNWRVQKFSPSR